MNNSNIKYENNSNFYYQIGNIKTLKPWNKPNYNSLYNYLSDIDILNILSNYNSYLIGTCLWNFNTNDIDIYLIPLYNISYDKMEEDINILNDISLNKYKLLTDISISYKKHILPDKQFIIDELKKDKNKKFENNNTIIKIGYYKKIIGNNENIMDFDIIKKNKINAIKLNNNYLIRYNTLYHDKKIIDRIINSKKDILINQLLISNFLSMTKENFINLQNY